MAVLKHYCDFIFRQSLIRPLDYIVCQWDGSGDSVGVADSLRILLLILALGINTNVLNAAERADLEIYDGKYTRVYSSRAAWQEATADTIPVVEVPRRFKADSLETAGPEWDEDLFQQVELSGAKKHMTWHRVLSAHTAENVDLLYLAYKSGFQWSYWPIGCWPNVDGASGISGGCDSIQVNIVSVHGSENPLVLVRQFASQYRAARGVYGTSIETSTESVQIWDAAGGRLLLNSIVRQTERRSGQIISGSFDPSGAGGSARSYETICSTAVLLDLTATGLVVDECRTEVVGNSSENSSNPCQELFIGPRAGTYTLTGAGFVRMKTEE